MCPFWFPVDGIHLSVPLEEVPLNGSPFGVPLSVPFLFLLAWIAFGVALGSHPLQFSP